ncbi:MAG: zf-HC2 domain-containing protein [Candidatus Latescibacteria bacterium]|nr:zf-HC2 domain-containing protein [Candidatus Latescibacterota bacterium]
MNRTNHPHDELQLLLDERLDAAAHARVEAHLSTCSQCRRELEALRWTQRAARGLNRPDATAPPEVAARVFAALDEEDRRASPSAHPERTQRGSRLLPALGIAVAAVIALAIVFLRPSGFDPTQNAADDLVRYATATLALDLETKNPQELEQFFADGRIAFPTRVFDFGMMNFELTGGRVHDIDGRRSALFAYTSASGGHIICQMYEGGVSELPDGFERHVDDGIEFRVYRRGTSTLVFWQEGPLVCVLASDGDPGEALAFARAKAQV